MKRIIIILDKHISERKISDFFQNNDCKVEKIIFDKREIYKCQLCKRFIINPTIVDGKIYGPTCATKIKKNMEIMKQIW